MPIDPRIVLGIQPVRFEAQDPIERYGRGLALQNLMGAGELQGVQLKSAQQGLADEEAVRGAYQEAAGDPATLRALLGQRGQLKALQGLDKYDLERRAKEAAIGKDVAAADKSRYDVTIDRIKRNAAIFSTATDQASWDGVRRQMAVRDPEVARQLPEQFNAQLIQAKIAEGLTAAEQLAERGRREALDETARWHTLTAQSAAAGRRTTERGQNITAQTAAGGQNKPVWDSERGIFVIPPAAQPAAASTGAAVAQPAATVAPPGVRPRLTEAQRKELMSIGQQESTIAGALKSVEQNPSAFSLERGMATMAGPMSETIRGRFDNSEQRRARSYVYNVVSKVINERAGAAQTPHEYARLRSFLPAEADNAQQVKDKLIGFQTYLKDLRKGVGADGQAAVQPAAAGAPAQPAAGAAFKSRFLGFE